MPSITVTALDDCVYRGRFIPLGELFTLPAVDAAVLRRQGRVALESDETKARAARAARTVAEPQQRRRPGRPRRSSTDD